MPLGDGCWDTNLTDQPRGDWSSTSDNERAMTCGAVVVTDGWSGLPPPFPWRGKVAGKSAMEALCT